MLRHTFATGIIDHNTSEDIVKDLLGHSPVQTTLNLYVHRNKYALLSAVNIMNSEDQSKTHSSADLSDLIPLKTGCRSSFLPEGIYSTIHTNFGSNHTAFSFPEGTG